MYCVLGLRFEIQRSLKVTCNMAASELQVAAVDRRETAWRLKASSVLRPGLWRRHMLARGTRRFFSGARSIYSSGAPAEVGTSTARSLPTMWITSEVRRHLGARRGPVE